jgi:hypothetical protein
MRETASSALSSALFTEGILSSKMSVPFDAS